MSVTITEQDLYTQIRILTMIRTKIQLLESELVYMPIANIPDSLKRLSEYDKQLSKLRHLMTEVISNLNGFFEQDKLF